MQVHVVPFHQETHLDETVQVLLSVRNSDPTYPPQVDVNYGAELFAEWLLKGEVISRWVAVADGDVVGHVAISAPHDYMIRFLSQTSYRTLPADALCEIVKLFVDPNFQRHGAGRLLLSHALHSAALLGRVPVLAVVSSSKSARRLYSQSALQEIGTFDGIHGTNYVFINANDPERELMPSLFS